MSGFSRWSSASAVLLTVGMTTGAIAPLVSYAQTATTITTNGEVDGFIRNGSTTYRFRNTSKRNAPTERAVGQEFNLTASQGDELEFSVDPEDGSNLKPMLILIQTRTGKQVAFDNRTNSLRYKVTAAGPYRLLVLAQGNTRGRFTLITAGVGEAVANTPQADQIMTDTLKLRIIGCGVPNVAQIRIGNEDRCTRDIEPGQYTYDASSRSLKVIDTRKDTIGQRLQLTMLDRCPSVTTSVVKIGVFDPQDGKQYTYCANPSRFVSAGEYTYDLASDRLQAATGTVVTQPSTTPPAQNDERRQLLQREYGLTVLDTCPPARSSLVVVAFSDPANANQGYVYCANPNRFLAAGEYIYNTTTAKLEPARKVQDCAVSLAGICLVK